MEQQALRGEIERVCRRLLSEQDRDRYSSTYGCFDRRYWSWKLTDFPEATFQRNVAGLAWLMGQVPADSSRRPLLADAVAAGLRYTFSIQHRDGSFDQAFPNERSFGATAFLVDPLLSAYLKVRNELAPDDRTVVETGLRKAADFLCEKDETHGLIANHLAGAIWSLTQCADLFSEARYERRAQALLQRVLSAQSEEGWIPEYDGADPGYQSLCIHYLAQVARRRPSRVPLVVRTSRRELRRRVRQPQNRHLLSRRDCLSGRIESAGSVDDAIHDALARRGKDRRGGRRRHGQYGAPAFQLDAVARRA
jgi:hypothetical protein